MGCLHAEDGARMQGCLWTVLGRAWCTRASNTLECFAIVVVTGGCLHAENVMRMPGYQWTVLARPAAEVHA